MRYCIARNGQVFGPYTTDEVEHYLGSGQVVPGDLAQVEGSDDWVVVEELFPAVGRVAAPPGVGGLPRLFPDPPNFPWWAVLLLTIFTGGLFSALWGVWQAAWLRKVSPATTSVWIYAAAAAVFLLRYPATIHTVAYNVFGDVLVTENPHYGLGLVALVLFFASRFTFRSELERHFNGAEPVGLRLGGWMTFFFGVVYLQYHFNRINEMKRVLRVSVPG